MKTTKITRLLTIDYNNTNKGFAATARYIADRAKEALPTVPAAPAKGASDADRKAIAAARRNALALKAVIEEARAIMAALNITPADLKRSGIVSLTERVVAAYPYRTADGVCVAAAAMPDYITAKHPTACKVVAASWLAVLSGAAAAVRENTTPVTDYVITEAPTLTDDNGAVAVAAKASGDIVDARGNRLATAGAVLQDWDALAPLKHTARTEGARAQREAWTALTEDKQ